jgi:hypothetical protein
MARQKGGKSHGRKDESAAAPKPQFISGKLVIITIAALALFAAGANWWFRYSTTHEAAEFWGPEASLLIRQAPLVHLIAVEPLDPANHKHDSSLTFADHYHLSDGLWHITDRLDISKAPGLSHLRTALLEDRNLRPLKGEPVAPSTWQGGLEFHSSLSGSVTLLFSPNCDVVLRHWPGDTADRTQQTGPIAEALCSVFAEWRANRSKVQNPLLPGNAAR